MLLSNFDRHLLRSLRNCLVRFEPKWCTHRTILESSPIEELKGRAYLSSQKCDLYRVCWKEDVDRLVAWSRPNQWKAPHSHVRHICLQIVCSWGIESIEHLYQDFYHQRDCRLYRDGVEALSMLCKGAWCWLDASGWGTSKNEDKVNMSQIQPCLASDPVVVPLCIWSIWWIQLLFSRSDQRQRGRVVCCSLPGGAKPDRLRFGITSFGWPSIHLRFDPFIISKRSMAWFHHLDESFRDQNARWQDFHCCWNRYAISAVRRRSTTYSYSRSS